MQQGVWGTMPEVDPMHFGEDFILVPLSLKDLRQSFKQREHTDAWGH